MVAGNAALCVSVRSCDVQNVTINPDMQAKKKCEGSRHYCGKSMKRITYNFFFSAPFSCLEEEELLLFRGTRWLRHCATIRKVASSIPDDATVIFQWHNPTGRTMALRSTQPLTEMSTRDISRMGKSGRCVGLTTLPNSCAECHEIWEPQPSGDLRASPGLYRDTLTFTTFIVSYYVGF